jgi:hypothetical protein
MDGVRFLNMVTIRVLGMADFRQLQIICTKIPILPKSTGT